MLLRRQWGLCPDLAHFEQGHLGLEFGVFIPEPLQDRIVGTPERAPREGTTPDIEGARFRLTEFERMATAGAVAGNRHWHDGTVRVMIHVISPAAHKGMLRRPASRLFPAPSPVHRCTKPEDARLGLCCV
jgi:hypothetical protein